MSKLIFGVETWTPVAVADNAAMTDNGYMALVGAAGTQRTAISEVYMGGQATVASATIMTLARDSTIGVTLTGLAAGQNNGPADPATGALAAPVVGFTASTTKPIRSNSTALGRLNLSFNPFGGVVRWVAVDPSSCFWIQGNTASLGEASLSAYTGGTPGLMSTHIMYETT